MTEVWRDITGYEGLYQISNTGRVKSLDRINNVGRHCKERMLSIGLDGTGYLMIGLYKMGKRYPTNIHRLVAIHFIANPGGKPQVNHIDGDKTNSIVTNLEWCTEAENISHAHRVGLAKSKLTKEEVEAIKNLKNKGLSQKIIGKMFNIDQTTVGKIYNNKCWVNI